MPDHARRTRSPTSPSAARHDVASGAPHAALLHARAAALLGPAAQLLRRPGPSASGAGRVVQRAKVNIRPATSGTLPGTISGVTFGRRPTSNSRIQGQHLTAFVAFQSMVLSHTLDRNVSGAAIALRAILPDIRAFIPDTPRTQYLLNGLDDLSTELLDVLALNIAGDPAAAKRKLEWSIDELLSIRNKAPGTSLATTNTGGHGESRPNGELMVMEKALLRNGGDPPDDWDEAEVAEQAGLDMWRLMDAKPVHGRDPAAIAAAMDKHIKQMELSFPKVFAWLSTDPAWYLQPLLLRTDADLPLAQLTATERRQVTATMTM